jgi:hypothetical protein
MPKAIILTPFALLLALSLFLAFAVAPAAAISDAELSRVNALLDALGQSQGLEFIRNGSAYPASKAVSHLRSKLSRAKSRLATAEEFIDSVASSSSLSGDPYYVRFSDGTEITAKEYFHSLLREIEKR